MTEPKPVTAEQRMENAIAAVDQLARKLRFFRTLLIAMICSFCLDIGVTVWLGILTGVVNHNVSHNQSVADCRNTNSTQFFQAEIFKVNGQIDGWQTQIDGMHEQVAALQKLFAANTQKEGKKDFRLYINATSTAVDGLQHVINQTQHYIDRISSIKNTCR